jgi:hypothetical protein
MALGCSSGSGGADALAPRTELRHLRPGFSTHLGKLFLGKGYHTRRLPRCDFSTETFNYRNCFKNSLGCAIYITDIQPPGEGAKPSGGSSGARFE